MNNVVSFKEEVDLFQVCGAAKHYLLLSVSEEGDMEVALNFDEATNGELSGFYSILGTVKALIERVMLEEVAHDRDWETR